MGLQLFSKRTWEEDSFNETNVASVLRDAKRSAMKIINKVVGIKSLFPPPLPPTKKELEKRRQQSMKDAVDRVYRSHRD